MPELPTPFNLRRQFALISLAVIVALGLTLGFLLSHALTQRMLQREGEVSMDFVRNLLLTDRSADFFTDPRNPELRARFLDSMAHISSMSDPVRANAYGRDGTVLWSTDKSLVGQRFSSNEELDEALTGRLVVHSGRADQERPDKMEHTGLAARTDYFVESYIPITGANGGPVLGVMELYKVPIQLGQTIAEAVAQLWLACAVGALALFTALHWTIARADRIMREQQVRLTEAQSLATAVELARAVAHNLRNPLASIRVSAELLETKGLAAEVAEESREDIIRSVDRANRWITELVQVTHAQSNQRGSVAPLTLLLELLREMNPEMSRSGIRWTVPHGQAPEIQAHAAMLRQILVSILTNAIEAMPEGGEISVAWEEREQRLALQIIDSGPGISDRVRRSLFKPFFSTKSGGLGIGLSIVRHTVEQWGGEVSLVTPPGGGTCVELLLPLAQPAVETGVV